MGSTPASSKAESATGVATTTSTEKRGSLLSVTSASLVAVFFAALSGLGAFGALGGLGTLGVSVLMALLSGFSCAVMTARSTC